MISYCRQLRSLGATCTRDPYKVVSFLCCEDAAQSWSPRVSHKITFRQGLTCLRLLGKTTLTYVGYVFHIVISSEYSSGLLHQSRNLWTIHPERSLIVLRWQDCTAAELTAYRSDLSKTTTELTADLDRVPQTNSNSFIGLCPWPSLEP